MPKILVVINGESFRNKINHTSDRGGETSFERQKIASMSHNRLIRHIKDKFQFDSDVFINSYALHDEYDKHFLSWYGDTLLSYHLHNGRFPSEIAFINDTMDRLVPLLSNDDYEYVLFVKADVYVKKHFLDVFKMDIEKIIFTHVDLVTASDVKRIDGTLSEEFPLVCHHIYLVPKQYFTLLTSKEVLVYHPNAYQHYSGIYLCKKLGREHIDLFIYTSHYCSSDIEWNPIYSHVGRHEVLEYEKSRGLYYNNENNTYYHIENDDTYRNLIRTDTMSELLLAD